MEEPRAGLIPHYQGRWAVLEEQVGLGEQGDLEEQGTSREGVIQQEEQNLETFPCKQCEKVFVKKNYLYYHKLRVHGEKQTCDICNKQLASKNKLKVHVQNVHEAPKFKCLCCSKTFSVRRNLKAHENLCGRMTRQRGHIPCSVCSKKYATEYSLRQHQHQMHTVPIAMGVYGKPVKELIPCIVCQKGYKSKAYLKIHMKTIHDAVEEEGRIIIRKFNKKSTQKENIIIQNGVQFKIQCPGCPDDFFTTTDLLKHKKKKHVGENVYNCTECNAKFTKNYLLINHKSSQHRGTQFKCSACPAKFKMNQTLRNHESRVHRNPQPHRLRKSNCDVRRSELKRREKEVVNQVKEKIATFPEDSQRRILKNLIKTNPNILDSYEKNPLTNEDIREMIVDNSIPDLVMLNILSKLRKKWGVKVAVKNIRKHLVERKQAFEPYFKNQLIKKDDEVHFENKKGEAVSRYLTYCTNVPGLIAMLKKEIPDFDNTKYFIVIAMDGGKNNLKICLNWSKRGVDSNKNKLMGPKHSLVLASVCSVDETHGNIKLLLDLIKANELDFKLSTDLKIVNMYVGKQSASCKFPCPYSDCTRDSHGIWHKGPKMATFNDLNENFEQYSQHGEGNRKKLMSFKNQEFEPLTRSNSFILYSIPPPVKVVRIARIEKIKICKWLEELDG